MEWKKKKTYPNPSLWKQSPRIWSEFPCGLVIAALERTKPPCPPETCAELKLKSGIASFSQPATTTGLLSRFLLNKKPHLHPLTRVGEPSSLKKASGLRTLAVSLVTLKGIDHIYQNKWQLTLQGRPARPRESEEKMSLEAHQQLGSFALGWVLPLPDFWAGEHFLRTAAWANCLRPSQAQPSGRNGFGVVCFSAIKEPFLVLAFVLASLWRNNLPGAI